MNAGLYSLQLDRRTLEKLPRSQHRPLLLIAVIQFPSGVVPLAEMAGFTPCMGICWSEIFLQGACPCLPPTSVF